MASRRLENALHWLGMALVGGAITAVAVLGEPLYWSWSLKEAAAAKGSRSTLLARYEGAYTRASENFLASIVPLSAAAALGTTSLITARRITRRRMAAERAPREASDEAAFLRSLEN